MGVQSQSFEGRLAKTAKLADAESNDKGRGRGRGSGSGSGTAEEARSEQRLEHVQWPKLGQGGAGETEY